MANIITSKTRYYKDVKPPLGSQINWAHPLARGLVGCWLMNEGGGLKVLNKINNYYDIISNFSSFNNWSQNSKGTGLKFLRDIQNSKIPLIIDPFSTSSPFTIVASVAPTNNDTNYGAIIGRGQDGSGAGWSIRFRYKTGNVYEIAIVTTSPSTTGRTTTGIKTYGLNIPVQAVAVWNPNVFLNLYTNGSIDKSNIDATSQLRTSGVGTTIGFNPGTAEYFNGIINYIYIYNRVLSPSEIQQLYIEPYCFIAPQKSRFIISMGETPTTPSIVYSTARLRVYTY